ncbi:MAG: membrane dipeptidase [Clostridium sp.]|nr:membrane dipeptidase [Clostridium sp.]
MELKTAADLPRLAQEMEQQGFTADEIEAVFSENVLRVYREIL